MPYGYFWSKNKVLGLIHDSKGLLLPFLLNDNLKHDIIQVFVVDTGPNAFSRFGVKELCDSAVEKMNKTKLRGFVFFRLFKSLFEIINESQFFLKFFRKIFYTRVFMMNI